MRSSRSPSRCTKSASTTGAPVLHEKDGLSITIATFAQRARGKLARQAAMLPWITVSASSQGCSLTGSQELAAHEPQRARVARGKERQQVLRAHLREQRLLAAACEGDAHAE